MESWTWPGYEGKNVQVEVVNAEANTYSEFANALSNPVILGVVNFAAVSFYTANRDKNYVISGKTLKSRISQLDNRVDKKKKQSTTFGKKLLKIKWWDWPIEKINRIDLAILHLSIYELLNEKTPPKVVIDEAVELAKEFGSEASGSFVNGVLGTVYEKLEKGEIKKNE